MWDFFTTVLLVVKIFWFSRLIFEIVSLLSISHGFQNPQNFEKTLLWFISISFSLLTCLYTIWYFIQFSRYILESSARLVVENKGFEPLTPCVQGRCSPSWANSPYACLFTNLLRYCSFSAVLTYISMLRSSKLACLVSSQKSCAFCLPFARFAHVFLKIHSAET